MVEILLIVKPYGTGTKMYYNKIPIFSMPGKESTCDTDTINTLILILLIGLNFMISSMGFTHRLSINLLPIVNSV